VNTRLAFLTLGLALAGPLRAQKLPLPVPGQRVRVTIPSEGSRAMLLTFGAIRADSIVFGGPESGTDVRRLALPLDAVARLEVSRGTRNHLRAGILVGFLAGMVGGTLAGADARDDPECTGIPRNPFSCLFYETRTADQKRGAILLSFAAAGTVIGALVGKYTTIELWQSVPLDRPRVTLAPLPAGRLGLGAAVRF
jgi:hypothetical protein